MRQLIVTIGLTLAAWTCLFASDLRSADIVDIGDCNFRISGVLESGDGKLFSKIIGGDCTYTTLHLDSPGGSVLEALDIVKQYDRTSTVIDRGSQCLSACSLLFMAGRVCAGSPFYCSPSRAMDKTAVLGFHAPFLTETTSNELVPLNLSFSAALDIFSNIQDTFSQISAEVKQTGYKKEIIPLDLMAKMFSTPPDKFFYIENNDEFFAFDISILDGGSIKAATSLSMPNVKNMCVNLIYSELRGWNYSAFGFDDYENLRTDTRNSAKDFVVKSVNPESLPPDLIHSKVDEYLMRFDYLNMGPLVSGWCRVTPDIWSDRGRYFDVRFYGEFGEPRPEVNIDSILSDDPSVQESFFRFDAIMHYTMGWPLRTPIKDIALPTETGLSAIDTVKSYFKYLGSRLPGSQDVSAADLWVSSKRKAVVGLVSNICGAEVVGIRSVTQERAATTILLTSRVRACDKGAFEEYKISVDLLKEGDMWRIAAIRSASW